MARGRPAGFRPGDEYFCCLFPLPTVSGGSGQNIFCLMANHEPPVYRAAYELTLLLFRWAKDCPKDYQPSLGFLVQEEALKLESALCHCQETPDKPVLLQKALGSCFLIRLVLRLLLDLGFIKLETSIAINLKIDEVATQLSGWRKSLLASGSENVKKRGGGNDIGGRHLIDPWRLAWLLP